MRPEGSGHPGARPARPFNAGRAAIVLGAMLAIASAAPGMAHAQGDTAASRAADSTVHQLPTIEVTAARFRARYAAAESRTGTKTNTPLRDTPQSITVITSKVIADQSMQSMADAVRYIPGVTMGQGEGNRDQPTIRGNNTTAGFFVDGMRDDVQYFRDLYNVDRVEALKGANALIFGRGSGGGVINRVTKTPDWTPVRDLMLQGGSYGSKRGTLDLGQGVSDALALRLNAVYENSDLYRDGVNLERYGVNPTAAIRLGGATRLLTTYEHFKDYRTADRGIPSFAGAPVAIASVRTFFGDPSVSYADARVDVGTVTVEHTTRGLVTLRNRSVFGDYDKRYQNVYPGGVNDVGTEVRFNAYNNATKRRNLFNESELVYRVTTGGVGHTLLGGVAFGRQSTDNFRNTGYFNDSTTTVTAPLSSPTIAVPVTFRQSATDADNHSTATSLSVYVQDQIVLSRHWQAIAGLRYERFGVDFQNARTGETLERDDDIISPRAGILFKPVEPVTLYASYGVSALPSSGDQFSSLNATTETLKPERFTNYEIGAKWDVLSTLSVAGAAYRLDRTNTTAPDPNDPGKTVQTGSQRATGVELTVAGAVTPDWQLVGGYGHQTATVTSRTAAAGVGAVVPLVPRNTVSLWNRYRVLPRVGLGLGVIYQDAMFAAIDDAVTLPGFTRFDAAAYVTVNPRVTLQANVENLFEKTYFSTAQNNNNITPGSPRALRVSVLTHF
jgi:catecholate siderophore receptor